MKTIYLGCDIGTKNIKLVYGSENQLKDVCLHHYCDPLKILSSFLKDIKDSYAGFSGYVTGKYSDLACKKFPEMVEIDPILPLIEYLRYKYPENINYVIDIGAGGLSLIEIKDGKFHSFENNSLCASGTGSFLDQQMHRLGLTYIETDRIQKTKRVPSIASRCAVFAKSDLIHRQQEGYSIEELWNGLIKGMAESCYTTLFQGRRVNEKVIFSGGLVKNKLFLSYFSEYFPEKCLIIPDNPETLSAASCQRLAENSLDTSKNDSTGENHGSRLLKTKGFEKPLFPKSKEKDAISYDKLSNEITLYKKVLTDDSRNHTFEVILGVDVGSTSTKAVLTELQSGEVLAGIYRKTQGNPVSAYQKILKAIKEISFRQKKTFLIKGMGTTGSGRRIVGLFGGADKAINEITAHLTGGLLENPEIKTIFEIGGQDSKYIQVEGGWMKDANMNYVCAAGTGSFLEETAKSLNFELDQFEELCRGVEPPKTNDRCTVFMENDAKKMRAEGYSKAHIVASLLYGVCRNYLHRVVQNRPVEEPILFLGATARNQALVEAFQNILQKEVITSPKSHLTGAIGVAEIVRQELCPRDDLPDIPVKSRFKGISLCEQKVIFNETKCTDCKNNCTIISFVSDERSVSWGHQCGREEIDTHRDASSRIDYFTDRENFSEKNSLKDNLNISQLCDSKHHIYVPEVLYYFSHRTFIDNLLKGMNFQVKSLDISKAEILKTALNYSPNEVCFPLKVAIGHVVHAVLKYKSPIFLPYFIQDVKNDSASNSFFCPMTQSFPSLVKSILTNNGISDKSIYSPVIDLSKGNKENIKNLTECFKKDFSFARNTVKNSFCSSVDKLQKQQDLIHKKGKAVVEKLRRENSSLSRKRKPVLVIVGRSYNLYDDCLNLGLIREIEKYGFDVIPMDYIPVKREELAPGFRNIYWSYAQKMITVAYEILKLPDFYPVVLTNFNCGPDSFLLTMLENIWGERPYLILELDEHNGNAGYLTRVEAFLDRIEKSVQPEHTMIKTSFTNTQNSKVNRKKNTLLIPPMNPIGTVLISSAFRRAGWKAEPLAEETVNTFQLGKSCLRGSECLPAASTLGAILKYCTEPAVKNSDKGLSVFMPGASGPCRFGQYSSIQKLALSRKGIEAEIISVNSENNYSGFSSGLRLQLLKSIILTDILIKLGCRLRPYEVVRGSTNLVINKYFEILSTAIEQKKNITKVLLLLKDELQSIERVVEHHKPLVGIVGEIYVRNSPFSNNCLVNKIIQKNAEPWLSPFMEWFHYTGFIKKNRAKSIKWLTKDFISDKLIDYYEKKYFQVFSELIGNRGEPEIAYVIEKARPYLPDSIRGEAVLTIGRTICFIEQGAKLVINAAPFGCMPGTISSIVLKNISQRYSVPVISLYYDGFNSFEEQLDVYLNNLG